MSIAATATMVLMLMLLAGFWILRTGLQAGLDYTESKVEVVADLKDKTKIDEVDAITGRLLDMPEVDSVDYVSEEEALASYRASPRRAGRGGLHAVPRRQSAPRQPRGQARRGERLRQRRRELLRAEPAVDQVKEQQATVDSLADDHERPEHGRHRRPFRDRVHRALHHRQHDPAGRRRSGRGDRDHAARRGVRRVHPLAVRVRGGDGRPARRGADARAALRSPPSRSAGSWSASSRCCH